MGEVKFSGIKKDLEDLILCIKCHEETDDVEVIQESLKTIMHICSNNDFSKEVLRNSGGLEYLFNLLCSTDSTLLLDCTLKTLACALDENVQNQIYLSRKDVFVVLHTILTRALSSSLLQKCILFISTILFQNIAAQVLITETGCLERLITLYESLCPPFVLNGTTSLWNNDNSMMSSVEMWQAVNTVLCFAVNNPLNEKNQTLCSALFPIALKILQTSSSFKFIGAVSSFLSLTIADNRKCQDTLAECDGLPVLKNSLQRNANLIFSEMRDFNNIVSKGLVEASNGIIGVIDTAVIEHESNAEVCGKIGVVSLLLKLLSVDFNDVQWKMRITLTLGHCVDACSSNKTFIFEQDNFAHLLKKVMLMGDEDIASSCKYILQICLENSNFEGSDITKAVNRHRSIELNDFPCSASEVNSSRDVRIPNNKETPSQSCYKKKRDRNASQVSFVETVKECGSTIIESQQNKMSSKKSDAETSRPHSHCSSSIHWNRIQCSQPVAHCRQVNETSSHSCCPNTNIHSFSSCSSQHSCHSHCPHLHHCCVPQKVHNACSCTAHQSCIIQPTVCGCNFSCSESQRLSCKETKSSVGNRINLSKQEHFNIKDTMLNEKSAEGRFSFAKENYAPEKVKSSKLSDVVDHHKNIFASDLESRSSSFVASRKMNTNQTSPTFTSLKGTQSSFTSISNENLSRLIKKANKCIHENPTPSKISLMTTLSRNRSSSDFTSVSCQVKAKSILSCDDDDQSDLISNTDFKLLKSIKSQRHRTRNDLDTNSVFSLSSLSNSSSLSVLKSRASTKRTTARAQPSSQMDNADVYHVISFTGRKCEPHGLIANFEAVKLSSLTNQREAR